MTPAAGKCVTGHIVDAEILTDAEDELYGQVTKTSDFVEIVVGLNRGSKTLTNSDGDIYCT